MRLLLASCFALSLAAAPAPPPDPTDCVTCHNTMDLAKFRTRTHGKLGCVTCHSAITTLPHPEKLPPPQCIRCHDHEGQDYASSVHGVARKQGKDHAPTCTTCHGHAHDMVPRNHPDSKVARRNMDRTCGKCHDAEHLKKLSTRLPKRASRMDLKGMPKP